ncbi:MAG: hypothetical protein ABI321_23300 [Polyangia bacterium]
MTRRLVLALALTALSPLLAACGAIPYDVSDDIPEQKVDGSPLGGLLGGFFADNMPITIDVSEQLAKHDTSIIHSANLKSLRFDATPKGMPSGNFDFVHEIHIFVDAPSNTSLPRIEIANLAPVPMSETSIDLNVVHGVDILPYINAGAEISATATGTAPTQDFTFTGHVVITIHI